MRRSILLALGATAALAVTPAFAQDEHAGHHPPGATAKAAPAAPPAKAPETKAAPAGKMAQGMDPAAMHKMCMDMTQSGQAMGAHKPGGKPAQGMAGGMDMAAMQQQCMQMMHQHAPTEAKPPAK